MQNQDLKEYFNGKGYFLQKESDINTQDIDLSLVSLRIALKAYFSTYKCFKGRLYNVKTFEKETTSYHKEYVQCIFHFHHFAELVLISFLRINKEEIFKNNNKTDEKHTIEFSLALKNLIKFIKNKAEPVNYQQLKFVLDNEEMLRRLNYLRNEVYHQGLHILYYEKLDEFIGKDVLPFIVSVT
ncbi:hypothetical protein [Nostoc sp.]|uniref:hypothetical protein n=1 Tax=Nostoc sp. TaxID=1180 RepID=UPI002FFA6084